MNREKISIIMLTHNAPKYVKFAVESIAGKTKGVDYELIVVDNHSRWYTRSLLKRLKRRGCIDVIQWNRKNLLFAKGNNIGSRMASPESTHLLLINSDVEVRDDSWLKRLLDLCPEGGICAYGVVENEPVRVDGYCMLVDKGFYERHGLDENYEWFWSITKLQAKALAEGKRVIGVKEHDDLLFHFGGKSGNAYRHAKGMGESAEVISRWFEEHHIEILEKMKEG